MFVRDGAVIGRGHNETNGTRNVRFESQNFHVREYGGQLIHRRLQWCLFWSGSLMQGTRHAELVAVDKILSAHHGDTSLCRWSEYVLHSLRKLYCYFNAAAW